MKIPAYPKAIRILLMTDAVIGVASYMIGPIYALFVEEIGGDILDASSTAAVLALAAGVTALLAGRFNDRIKQNELIIVFGHAVTGIGFLLYLFADSIWMLFLIQIIIGFAAAVYAPTFDDLYSRHLKHGQAGLEWGTWESAGYFTTAIGAFLGGLIVSYFGFNVLFVVMALMCFGSATYLYLLPRRVL